MSDDLSIPSPTYRVQPHRRRGGMDPALQRLLMYAGGVVVVAAVIGGVSMLFNRHGGPVPVVQADPRPLRVKPDHPGGMQIAGTADTGAADDGTTMGKLAPAPETPDPTALRAPPAPAPQAAAPVVPASPPVVAAPAPAARAAVVPPAPPLARAAAPTDRAAAAPAARTAAAPVPAAAPPAPVPAAAPATLDHAGAKPAPGGKSPAIQLAALASEDAAKVEWQHMEHRMPELLGGRTPTYSKIEVGGRTYWRVRVNGFGDVAQAKAFCDRVRAKNASCSVADF